VEIVSAKYSALSDSCSPEVKIKAAGGIRTLSDMLKAIDAGASRIGATATAAILEEVNSNLNSTIKNESQEINQTGKINETDFNY
jgi:deoxyribose-phosphate aldolase